MRSLSDPDDGLRLIINLCLLSIHHTVLYTLNLLSLRPFVEYIECEMVSIALPPPPSNASIVPETVHLAQIGSYPWDRNHATLPLFHITTSPLPYSSGLVLPSYPFKKNPSSLSVSLRFHLPNSSGATAITWYFLAWPLPVFHKHELCFEECLLSTMYRS